MSTTRLVSAPPRAESTFFNPLYGGNSFKSGNASPPAFGAEPARHKAVDFAQGLRSGRATGITRPGILRSPGTNHVRHAPMTAAKQGLRWRDARDLVQTREYEPEGGFDKSTMWKPDHEKTYTNFWSIPRPEVRDKLLQVDSRFSRNPHLVYAPDSRPPLEDLAAWLMNLGRE